VTGRCGVALRLPADTPDIGWTSGVTETTQVAELHKFSGDYLQSAKIHTGWMTGKSISPSPIEFDFFLFEIAEPNV
jgi:hypothetical protein